MYIFEMPDFVTITAWSSRTFDSDANLCALLFSGMLQHVVSYIFTDVSEETAASTFRIKV
jgi:hypothetical protein